MPKVEPAINHHIRDLETRRDKCNEHRESYEMRIALWKEYLACKYEDDDYRENLKRMFCWVQDSKLEKQITK